MSLHYLQCNPNFSVSSIPSAAVKFHQIFCCLQLPCASRHSCCASSKLFTLPLHIQLHLLPQQRLRPSDNNNSDYSPSIAEGTTGKSSRRDSWLHLTVRVLPAPWVLRAATGLTCSGLSTALLINIDVLWHVASTELRFERTCSLHLHDQAVRVQCVTLKFKSSTRRDRHCDYSWQTLRLFVTQTLRSFVTDTATIRDRHCDHSWQTLRPFVTDTAIIRDRHCDHSWQILRLFVTHTATIRDRHCGHSWQILRPFVTDTAIIRDTDTAIIRDRHCDH